MAFRVNQILKSPLGVGTCITATIVVVGIGCVFLKPQPNPSTASQSLSETAQSSADLLAAFKGCLTIVSDPQPPLNVRAAPTDRFNNIVGNVEDGNPVTVIGKQRGWLQISAPVPGWVDQSLTKTICDQAEQAELAKSAAMKTDVGNRVLAEAIEAYQSGDLTSAIKLMKTIPEDSSVYAQAQVSLKTMPNQWKRAESLYGNAQTALKENRAADVLRLVGEVPDIRYWRQKFAPLVKQAIYYQQHGAAAPQRKSK
ncbi:MAG: SH3 domain-containing protein [Phormidesmis sp. CAN_BIN36]|nr:SH3 domain-containing protein [Phormidesmis sp. CAN_BIN36]